MAFLASNSLHEVGNKKIMPMLKLKRILNKFSEIQYSVGCMVWSVSICLISIKYQKFYSLVNCNTKIADINILC